MSLLGLGITHSASAGTYYTFTGTLSGVDITGPDIPDPVPFSVGDPFTGFAFYDPVMGTVGFSAETSNGFRWIGSWCVDDGSGIPVFSPDPFSLNLFDPTCIGAFTNGRAFFELDEAPGGFRGFEYFGTTAQGRVESVGGTITSFQAIPDAGNTAKETPRP